MTRIRLAAALAAVLALFVPAFAEAPEIETVRGPMPSLTDAAAWSNTKPLTEKDFKGKVLIVHFWAFGAGSGQENFETYVKWTTDFQSKGALLFGVYSPARGSAIVNPREFGGKPPTLDQLMAKAKAEGVTFPTAWDSADRKVGRAWDVKYPSTIFLIDRKGKLRYKFVGDLTVANDEPEKVLREKIESLLKERP